jgi:hypothetical protein
VSDMPVWFAITTGLLLFGFGVFVGYAIAAWQELRRSERDLADLERRQDERGWE